MAMKAEVWVWVPRDQQGAVEAVLEELLHEGRGLARRLGGALVAISDRDPGPDTLKILAAWGVARVRVLGWELPLHPRAAGEGFVLDDLRGEGPPAMFLFAANAFGRVAAPTWAARTGAAVVTGVTGITADGSGFVAARPSHRERYEALVRLPFGEPLVATLRPGAVGEVQAPVGGGTKPEVVRGPKAGKGQGAGDPPPAAQLVAPNPATLELEEAERIVAFGRGAFSPEAVALVERLAEALGAVVAGSRPAADEGWLPFSRQIGLTGAIVRPRLYVAVGISGAPYHMVGVKDAETLVAINNDPEAPILGAAHLGIVGDLHQVLPRLIEQVAAGGRPVAALAAGAGKGNG